MAEFEFSLQTALDLRSRAEEKAQRRLASAQRQVSRCRSDLDRTRESHDSLIGSLRGDGEPGRINVAMGRMEHEHRVLAELRRRLGEQRQRLSEAERELEARRSELLAASRAKLTLERLSERQAAEYRRIETLAEQRELNEAAISRHHMANHSAELLTGPANDS